MNKDDIVFISENEDGNFYIGYKVKVQRGIKGKTRSKVDELVIVGMNRERFMNWLEQNDMEIVYE